MIGRVGGGVSDYSTDDEDEDDDEYIKEYKTREEGRLLGRVPFRRFVKDNLLQLFSVE